VLVSFYDFVVDFVEGIRRRNRIIGEKLKENFIGEKLRGILEG